MTTSKTCPRFSNYNSDKDGITIDAMALMPGKSTLLSGSSIGEDSHRTHRSGASEQEFR